jgi:hypothetical protein
LAINPPKPADILSEVTTMASLRALNWVLLDDATDNPVKVGDVVSVEAGGMPIYQVMALADGQAWLDDERHAALEVLPLDRFRWKGAAA